MYVDGPVNDPSVTKTPGVRWVAFWVRIHGLSEMKRLRELLPAASRLGPREFVVDVRKHDSMFPVAIMTEEEAEDLAAHLRDAGLQPRIG